VKNHLALLAGKRSKLIGKYYRAISKNNKRFKKSSCSQERRMKTGGFWLFLASGKELREETHNIEVGMEEI